MVTRRLARLGAYDLRDDWSDICQEIVWSLVKSARAGRAPSDEKLGAYISQAVWNRFASMLRQHHLRDAELHEEAVADADGLGPADNRLDIDRVNARQAFARLPHPTQELLWARYVEGITIDAIVERSGRSRASVNRDIAAARGEFGTLLGLAKASAGRSAVAPSVANDDTMRSGPDGVDGS
jgi:DNA-directed RNA polymerase specialized sigma24 family protein